MHTQPYLLDRLHAAREHDMLDAARRARLGRAIEVATESGAGLPSVRARVRRQLARFAPHRRTQQRRLLPA